MVHALFITHFDHYQSMKICDIQIALRCIARKLAEILVVARKLAELLVVARKLAEILVVARKLAELLVVARKLVEFSVAARKLAEPLQACDKFAVRVHARSEILSLSSQAWISVRVHSGVSGWPAFLGGGGVVVVVAKSTDFNFLSYFLMSIESGLHKPKYLHPDCLLDYLLATQFHETWLGLYLSQILQSC